MDARSLISGAFVFTIALFALATPINAAASTPPAQPPVIQWTACATAAAPFECATVSVPLDYDQPDGERISLALARVPATDQAHRIGTLFMNPGGPAGSGVSMVLNGFGQFMHSQLQGRFDIVSFDPRGVRLSTPVQCFD